MTLHAPIWDALCERSKESASSALLALPNPISRFIHISILSIVTVHEPLQTLTRSETQFEQEWESFRL
ncbi:hypothetical protein VNO77_20047 [Canavalia gladiata]|uniref:Uncharacterized protein n=1 Tax=Canavalia gladiata TaxID=3824 RepID=A0AAN9LS27_CANGL